MDGSASSERPLLSALLIVRDEERNLPRCLESLRGLEALGLEIVVVDTGSIDATREIARDCGLPVKLREFPWNGNEADARNVSVAHATGRWLFQIDADEEVSPGLREELIDLLPEIDAGPFQACSLVLKNLYLHGTSSRSRIVRIGRAVPGYAFSGVVHPAPAYGAPIVHLRGELLHYGYQWTPESRRRKGRHLIEQLELRPEGEKATLRHYSERLMALLIAGDEEVFAREWERQGEFSLAAKMAGPEALFWSHALGNALLHFADRDDFASGEAAAAQLIVNHQGHVRATFYLLQGAARREAWDQVGALARSLRGLGEGDGRESIDLLQAVPDGAAATARAWEWLADLLSAPGAERPPFPKELWQPRLLPVVWRAAAEPGLEASGRSVVADKMAAALLALFSPLDGTESAILPQAESLTAAALQRAQPGSATRLLALAARFRLNRRLGRLEENGALLREALADYGAVRWLPLAFPPEEFTEEAAAANRFPAFARRALMRI